MLKHLTKLCDIKKKNNVIIVVPLMPILIFPMTLSHYDLTNKKQKKCNNQRRSKRSGSVDAYILDIA